METTLQAIRNLHSVLGCAEWSMDFDEYGQIKECCWSDEVRDILGASGESELPNSFEEWADLISEEDRQKVIDEFGEMLWDFTGEKNFDVQFQMLTKKGYRWLRAVATLSKNEAGLPVKLLGLFMDVDEKKRMEANIVKQMEGDSALIEGLGVEYYSVLMVDVDNDTMMTYRADGDEGEELDDYFKKYDYSWSESIANYCFDFVGAEAQMEFMDVLSLESLNSYTDYRSVTYPKYVNGEVIYQETCVTHVERFGGSYVVIVSTRSVDNMMKREIAQKQIVKEAFDAAEMAHQAKASFLSNMSHDIRTPMNGILGMTAIASNNLDDKEKVKDSLQKIRTVGLRLMSMLTDVLDMTKIETGTIQLQNAPFDIKDLIEEVLQGMQYKIDEKKHNVELDTSKLKNTAVIGDCWRLQQVLSNLLNNAVQYTPTGGRIRITVQEKEGQNKVGCYEFIIEDNGIGMSSDYIKTIFEPFTRAADGRVGSIQGNGLGMSLSRNIVRLMGGDIMVNSELDEGTRAVVLVYLLLQGEHDEGSIQLENEMINKASPFDELKSMDLSDYRVLVVEDNELNAEIALELLQMTGLQVELANDGSVAVDYLDACPDGYYDFILMDIKMPGMNGYEATKAIRRSERVYCQTVPIIAMTANAFMEDIEEAKASGMNEHIAKPLDIAVLVGIIKKWLV